MRHCGVASEEEKRTAGLTFVKGGELNNPASRISSWNYIQRRMRNLDMAIKMEHGQINRRVPTVVMRLVTIHLAAVTYDEEEIGS